MSVQSSDPRLVWPRSDGSPSNWPSTDRTPGPSWYEPVDDVRHQKYTIYNRRAGERMAGILGIPPRANGQPHVIGMPDGYKIFVHKQPRQDGTIRDDYYCFGSANTRRIRSSEEWKDHAEWLFDLDKPFDQHNQQCGCQIKKGSRLSTGGAKGAPRTSEPKERKPKKPKMEKSPESDENEITGTLPERAQDLASQRRYRRGELIWFSIDPIAPPPSTSTSTLTPPTITHWPGLISDIKFKSKFVSAAAAPNPPTVSSLEGNTLISTSPEKKPKFMENGGTVHHYFEHHLRPLGLFSRKFDIIRHSEELLPWQVGNELLGGVHGWRLLDEEGIRVLKESVEEEVANDAGKKGDKSIKERWDEGLGKRYRFEELSGDWDEAVFRLSVALQTAIQISKSWCQTDRIELVDPEVLSEEDKILTQTGQKNYYQGLWLGGERIWADDIVRIKKDRLELPEELGVVGVGAENKAVMLKIRAIALQINQPPDLTNEQWSCFLYGDIAETSSSVGQTPGGSGWVMEDTGEMSNGKQVAGMIHNFKVVKGFKYKQLNSGLECTVDVNDVAGRIYPDLLEAPTQNWFSLPGGPLASGRHLPGKTAQALVGLVGAKMAATEAPNWIEDLYQIVDTATKQSEKTVKDQYILEIEKSLGPIPLVPKKAPKIQQPAAQLPTPSASADCAPLTIQQQPQQPPQPQQAAQKQVILKPSALQPLVFSNPMGMNTGRVGGA